MTEREHGVFNYFKQRGILFSPFKKESTFKDYTNTMLDMLGALSVRQNAGLRSGIADLLVCYKGRFIAIELKDDVGTPSPQQTNFIAKTITAGGKGAVCRTLLEVLELLAE